MLPEDMLWYVAGLSSLAFNILQKERKCKWELTLVGTSEQMNHRVTRVAYHTLARMELYWWHPDSQ